ncbi:MAG TPA: POTRA domain-containing protein, partial [Longimicrobium sp.]|nr:POTRA domain-containing protein [Longimicrobium sp.]
MFALCGAAPAARAQDPTAPAARPGEQAPRPGFVVDTVLVRGSRRVPEATVRAQAGIRAGTTMTAPLVQDAIRRLMATGNYESAQVLVRGADAGRGPLVLQVVERPLVAQVRFTGLTTVPGATVRDSAGLKENAPLDPQGVARARTLVREMLAKKGVQLLSVDTALSPAADGAVNLTFRVREGPLVALADIDFEGNTALSDAALLDAMSTKEEGFWWFRPGRWDREAFDEDLRTNLPRVYGERGYIDFAVLGDSLVVDPATGKARLIVTVSEGPQYRLGEFNVQGNSRFPSEALRETFLTQRRSVLGLPFGGQSQREAGEVFDRPA